jgi:hypothetical protein
MQTPLHTQAPPHKEDRRSMGELLTDLINHMSTLVRTEIELARAEMSQKISKTVKDVATMAIGGSILFAGFLALLATAVIVLGKWMPLWVSALIVSLVALTVGAVMLFAAKNRLSKRDMKPSQTIISLKENKAWIKNRK